jgi:hypothetical protein
MESFSLAKENKEAAQSAASMSCLSPHLRVQVDDCRIRPFLSSGHHLPADHTVDDFLQKSGIGSTASSVERITELL